MISNLIENSITKTAHLTISYQYLFDSNTQSQVSDLKNVQIYNQMLTQIRENSYRGLL